MPPKKKLLNQHQLEHYLKTNGFQLIDRGSFWHSNAVYRDGDNPTALQIFKDTGVTRDFVQGGAPFSFSRLQRLVGKKATLEYSEERVEKKETIKMDKTWDREILKRLLPADGFYHERKISSKTLRLLNGGFANNGKLHSRYVFPIFREDDRIVGFTGRYIGRISKDSEIPKWKHLGRKTTWVYPSFVKNKESFPFQDAIAVAKEVIVVESVGDLLALVECGVYNVLVAFGTSLSKQQLAFLARFSDLTVTLAFNYDNTDGRPGFFAAAKTYYQLLSMYGDKVRIKLPEAKDFGDWFIKVGKDMAAQYRNKASDTYNVIAECHRIAALEPSKHQDFLKLANKSK